MKVPGVAVPGVLLSSQPGDPELRYLAQSFARVGYTVNCPFIPGMTKWAPTCPAFPPLRIGMQDLEAEYEEMTKTCIRSMWADFLPAPILSLKLAERPEQIGGIVLLASTLWPNGWAIPWYFNFFRLVRERFTARLFHFRQRAPYGIKDERIRKFVIESFAADDRPIEDLFGRGGGLVYQLDASSRM